MKCDICRKEYDPACDYRQGRCPNHNPSIDLYNLRFYNLIQAIKNLFKR